MIASTTTPEITEYRDAVRAALADLSAEDRDDLMEDVESHLIDVAAEDDGSLARLGTPADYAAELRSSAGLPAQAPPVRESFWASLNSTLADSAAGRGIERITRTQWWLSFRRFLPELRPGWWVLRGYLVVWVIAGVFFADQAFGVLPRINNSAVLGVLLAGVGIWASVRLGMRAQARPPRRARRYWGIVFTGVLLVVTFALLVSSDQALQRVYQERTYGPAPDSGLSRVTNIYAFDSEGRSLTGVQLFDQDGNPLQAYGQAYDIYGNPVTVRPYVDENGNEVYNVYPREAAPGRMPRPQFNVPRIAPPGGQSVEPSPGTSPSAAPSAVPSVSPAPR